MQQIERKEEPTLAGQSIIESGAILRRTQTPFTTAIAVIKPRVRNQVIGACEDEARIAGDEFYYSWTIKTRQGPRLIEGLSVQGALASARNWGNCAVPVDVEETEDAYIFTASFLDMETGFNLQRSFRQRKEQDIGSKYDDARAEDIVFQIGQSKAIRNVILNALPSWLISKVLVKAKENVIEKINTMGLATAKQKTVDFLGKYGITVERIENKLGKKSPAWMAEDLVLLQGAMNTLLAGQESADSLFPEVNQEATDKTSQKARDLELKLRNTKTKKITPEAGRLGTALFQSGIEADAFYEAIQKQLGKITTAWTPEDYQEAERTLNSIVDGGLRLEEKDGEYTISPIK